MSGIGAFGLAGSAVAAPRQGLGFVALQPARLFDSRPGTPTVDTLGAGSGPVAGGSSATVPVLGRGGVPVTGVGAVVLNITAIDATQPTFVSVFAGGSVRPDASVVNPVPSVPAVASLTVVAPGAGGAVEVFNAAGWVGLVVDVVGFFPAGAGFGRVAPSRVLDTRVGGHTVDGVAAGDGALAVGESRVVKVAGRAGVPASVGSVLLNVTAPTVSERTFLTVHAAGTSRPNVSVLNPIPGFTVSNFVVAQVNAAGEVAVFNSLGTADVLVDVVGWLPIGLAFHPITQARVADTRTGGSTIDGVTAGPPRADAGRVVTVKVAGRAGVPASGVGAVALNVTVVDPTQAAFVSVFPAATVMPVASTMNPTPVTGASAAAALVKVSTAGEISVYLSAGSADVIVDVVGWFPDPVTTSLSGVGGGSGHSCVTGESGSVWCWGGNDVGQLGTTSVGVAGSNVPVQVVGFDDAVSAVTGSRFSCALTLTGVVKCWGGNAAGQLGNGDLSFTDSVVPQTVSLPAVTELSAGFEHVCALTQSGEVWCWGYNSRGQLGDNQPLVAASPTPVLVAGVAGVTAIGSGGEHSCAITSTATVCWGSNSDGQLGNNDPTMTSSAAPVAVAGVPVLRSLGLGRNHSCAAATDTSVWCWGANSFGQAGVASTPSSFAPTVVAGVAGAVRVAGGGGHTCAATETAGVWCWGDNSVGQLGTGLIGIGGPTPSVVVGVAGGVRVTAGRGHSCVIDVEMRVWCWGRNDFGQVGDGTFETGIQAVEVLW